MKQRTRLDILLTEKGFCPTRTKAQAMIMAGNVLVNEQKIDKPGTFVDPESVIRILGDTCKYVSRGGLKLEGALKHFGVDPKDVTALDIGASTGGFTDCLLQHGAAKVYAIDVGYGVLSWSLRQDSRVVVMERQNARYLTYLPEPVSLITVDVSFISLKVLLPVFKGWFSALTPLPPLLKTGEGADITHLPFSSLPELGEGTGVRGEVLALIKPQFEAGRAEVRRGQGVIRDPQVHRLVLLDVLGFAEQECYGVNGLIRSPLLGPKGNTEFLAWLSYPAVETIIIPDLINQLLPL